MLSPHLRVDLQRVLVLGDPFDSALPQARDVSGPTFADSGAIHRAEIYASESCARSFHNPNPVGCADGRVVAFTLASGYSGVMDRSRLRKDFYREL